MKIAVTYEKGMVFQHFGKSEQFLVVEVEQTKLLNKSLLSADGQGHSALVTLLAKAEIDTLICGGLGQGARNALEQAGITVISGAFGNAEAAVELNSRCLFKRKLAGQSERSMQSSRRSSRLYRPFLFIAYKGAFEHFLFYLESLKTNRIFYRKKYLKNF